MNKIFHKRRHQSGDVGHHKWFNEKNVNLNVATISFINYLSFSMCTTLVVCTGAVMRATSFIAVSAVSL